MSHPPKRSRLRSRLLLTATATATALALAACGSSSTSSTSSSSAASSAGSSAASSAAGSAAAESGTADAASFPVEIPNAFGKAVIPAVPERVVVIGFTEADTVLALGTVPVGIQQFVSTFASGVGPWAEPLLAGENPTVFTTFDLNFEQIAALQPDLIIGLNRGITAEDYPKLTAIAPTMARPAEFADFGVPGEEQVLLIGEALGKQAAASELLAEEQAQIAAAAADNPEFAGKTFSAVWPRPEGAGWFAWTSIDPRVQLITDLGMTLSPEIEALGNTAFYNEISRENTPEINADVVVAIDENQQQATVLADPLFQSLPAAQGGNVAWVTDPPVIGAFAYSSVLSTPYVLEALVPLLSGAVAGGTPSGAASSSAPVTTTS
jgi:iron-siderophore transport system substrate-binding protein